jgi:hypothetical protein
MTGFRLALAAAFAAMLVAVPAAAQTAKPPAGARPAGGAEVVTAATLSRDGLKAIFEGAKLPTALEGAGSLAVQLPDVLVTVAPGKDTVRLMASFAFAPRAAMQEKLDLANRINDEYILVRAAIPAERPGEIVLDHYVVLGPGVSPGVILAATRRFAVVVVEAVATLDSDSLLK